MSQIHTSYKVSKAIKEFLGEAAPNPISDYWWTLKNGYRVPLFGAKAGFPAYQLHDLLSKPFCEAMAKKTRKKCAIKFSVSHLGWLYNIDIHGEYWIGGMEAVEKALTEMMEGK